MKKYKIGYTTGVFDLFHIGHLNILRRAKEQCEYLIVGISTDELVFEYKKKKPVIPFEERKQIVEAIKYVDEVIPQVALDKIGIHINLKFNAIFVGSDWNGTKAWNEYEQKFNEIGVDVVYLSYTEGTSSTLLSQVLNDILK